jgi:hypothetical protein
MAHGLRTASGMADVFSIAPALHGRTGEAEGVRQLSFFPCELFIRMSKNL